MLTASSKGMDPRHTFVEEHARFLPLSTVRSALLLLAECIASPMTQAAIRGFRRGSRGVIVCRRIQTLYGGLCAASPCMRSNAVRGRIAIWSGSDGKFNAKSCFGTDAGLALAAAIGTWRVIAEIADHLLRSGASPPADRELDRQESLRPSTTRWGTSCA